MLSTVTHVPAPHARMPASQRGFQPRDPFAAVRVPGCAGGKRSLPVFRA
jgi:hypothetical protein